MFNPKVVRNPVAATTIVDGSIIRKVCPSCKAPYPCEKHAVVRPDEDVSWADDALLYRKENPNAVVTYVPGEGWRCGKCQYVGCSCEAGEGAGFKADASPGVVDSGGREAEVNPFSPGGPVERAIAEYEEGQRIDRFYELAGFIDGRQFYGKEEEEADDSYVRMAEGESQVEFFRRQQREIRERRKSELGETPW